MALTSYVALTTGVPIVVGDSAITGNVVVGGVVAANDDTSVDGIAVDTVGMTIIEVVARSLCLD